MDPKTRNARIETAPTLPVQRESALDRASFEELLPVFAKTPSESIHLELLELLQTHPERMGLAHWACSLLERTSEIRGAGESPPDLAMYPAGSARLLRSLYCDILDFAGYQNLGAHKREEWGLANQTPIKPHPKSASTVRSDLAERLAAQLHQGSLSPTEAAALRLLAPERAYPLELIPAESAKEAIPVKPVREHFIDLDRDEYRTPVSPHLQLGIPLEWRALAIVHILAGILPLIPRALVIDLLWSENTRRTHLEMRMQKLLERLQKTHGIGIRSVSHRTRGAPAPHIDLSPEAHAGIEVRIRGRRELPTLLQEGRKIRTADITQTYGLSRSHAKRLYNAFIEKGWMIDEHRRGQGGDPRCIHEALAENLGPMNHCPIGGKLLISRNTPTPKTEYPESLHEIKKRSYS